MPISKEQLSNIIANKAAALCRPEYDDAKSTTRRNISEGYGGPSPSDFDGDAARWDAMFSDTASEDYDAPQPMDIQYSNAGVARSQMPEAIKKSMMENRIDVSNLGNTSVLDSLGIKAKPTTAPTQKKRQVVTEQVQSYVPQQVNVGVDYSIIKAIVSECIKDYFSNNTLNESTIKSIALKKGKISIISANGDVFQAKLEKVGNVNDNKK